MKRPRRIQAAGAGLSLRALNAPSITKHQPPAATPAVLLLEMGDVAAGEAKQDAGGDGPAHCSGAAAAGRFLRQLVMQQLGSPRVAAHAVGVKLMPFSVVALHGGTRDAIPAPTL
jgi:hypothetical protein